MVETEESAAQAKEQIWQCVAAIPFGKVASYGQIATLSSLPNGARLVGHVLKKLPKDTQLPWHRVVNAARRISLPAQHPSYAIQQQRLRDEGVQFDDTRRIPTHFFQW